ncbi:MAG: kelch repeat-containing protein [Steroidobacteraceae bacterium]
MNGTSSIATSDAATLTVVPAPTFDTQPQPLTVIQGHSAQFSVAAQGSGVLSYQWRKDGTSVSGATAASFSISSVSPSDAGTYDCVVTNTENGTSAYKTSTAAILTVLGPPPNAAVVTTEALIAAGSANHIASTPAQAGVTYAWTIGNGALTAGQGTNSITFTAGQVGTTTLTVSVVNATATTYGRATSTVVATLPLASIFAQGSVFYGSSDNQASATQLPGQSYSWSLINGTATGTIIGSTTGPALRYSIGPNAGTYQLSLTVRDQSGATATSTRTLNAVQNAFLKDTRDPLSRVSATATPLFDGRVLVAGGMSNGATTSSAEVFDPQTRTWALVGSLAHDRTSHTAVALNDGRILVVGGNGGKDLTAVASAELYDPATQSWSPAGSLTLARSGTTATRLLDGTILVAGGYATSVAVSNAEIYHPNGNAWTVAAGMGAARAGHTATLLNDGRVLVTGGGLTTGGLASAELYDPATNSWSLAAPMAAARTGHTATLLPNGEVLVVGGYGVGAGPVETSEIYDPARDSWTPAAPIQAARYYHSAVLLQTGKILVAGGQSGSSSLASTELYDPDGNVWSPGGAMTTDRIYATMVLLSTGQVVVAGGSRAGGPAIADPEIYDPAANAWTATGSLTRARSRETFVKLSSGIVMIFGASMFPAPPTLPQLARAELFDPSLNSWKPTGAAATQPDSPTATLLQDGRVLLTGGGSVSSPLGTAALYDPAADAWTAAAPMAFARSGATSIRLSSGRVLVCGGFGSNAGEIYDPSNDAWASTAQGASCETFASAVTLPGGTVLIGGGRSNAVVYDPAGNTWSNAGFPDARYDYPISQLPSGRVLASAGVVQATPAAFQILSSAFIYDASANTWTGTGGLTVGRHEHASVTLPSGKVLISASIEI